jgi:TonB family protein
MDNDKSFRSAVILSLIAHLGLFLLILVSPSLPKSSKKGMIHYVNLISLPGGGGGGGGESESTDAETPLEKRETLRDLTTPQKFQEQPASTFRHPVDEPKKEKKPSKEKKAVIRQPPKKVRDSSKGGPGSGTGAGLRIGLGNEAGLGSGFSSQIGLSSFPFTYYLQIIMDRVSANWFTSLVDPGVSGTFQTTVFFKIYRNGQISSVEVEESSGIRSLDLSAVRAVHSSSPFPPLPKEYEEEYLGIHLIFEHSK